MAVVTIKNEDIRMLYTRKEVVFREEYAVNKGDIIRLETGEEATVLNTGEWINGPQKRGGNPFPKLATFKSRPEFKERLTFKVSKRMGDIPKYKGVDRDDES